MQTIPFKHPHLKVKLTRGLHFPGETSKDVSFIACTITQLPLLDLIKKQLSIVYGAIFIHSLFKI